MLQKRKAMLKIAPAFTEMERDISDTVLLN